MMHVGSGELSHEDSSMTDTCARTHGPFLERPLFYKEKRRKSSNSDQPDKAVFICRARSCPSPSVFETKCCFMSREIIYHGP